MFEIMALAVIILVIRAVIKSDGKEADAPAQVPKYTLTRCPSCDGEIRIYGDRWECCWCGDFGRITK